MPNVGTASVDIDVDGPLLGRNIRKAVDSQSGGISSSFRKLGSIGGDAISAGFKSTLRIAEHVGAAAAVAGVALGGFGLKVAGDFQQTRIAFEGILGSAEKAQAFLTTLRDFAACVDAETEALTQEGWRRYDELCVGDLVLTVNQSTGKAEWEPVLALNVYPGMHDVLHIHGEHHDSVSTMNHRWPIYARGLHGDRVLTATSETLREGDRLIGAAPLAAPPIDAVYTDEFVELVAWFWTEGSIHPQRVTIAQSERANPEKVERTDRVMEKLFGARFPGERGTWGRSGPDAEGGITFRIPAAIAKPLLDAAPDRVPAMAFLLGLTPTQLELFIAVSLLGDGHVRPQTGQTVLTQKRQDQAQRFADAVTLSGRRCRVYEVENGRRWAVSVYRATPLVGLSHASRTEAQWTRRKLEGVVWCPTVPNGTWLARRGGHAYFTGNSTPFEFPELADAAKQLLAVGFEARDVIPIMTTLGNTAAALGVGGEAINGVVRALGQMKGKGKASAEELNQISEQIPGFSAVKAIAEDMGITVEEAFKRMEAGAIPADRAISAILKGMERFPGAAGAMQRQSKTLNGVISTLKDTFRDALIDGIEPFLPGIAAGLERSAPLVQRGVTGLVGALKAGIQGARDFITEFRLIERVKDAWPGIQSAITGAVGTAVRYVQDNWPKITGVFESALTAVKGAVDLAKPVIEVAGRIADDLIDNLPKLSGALDSLGGALEGIGGFVSDHLEGFKQLAEIIGVVMVARLIALKVQILLTFGEEVIARIGAFALATEGASAALAGGAAAGAGGAAAGGLAGAAGAAGLSLGGVLTAAALLVGGIVILGRTINDHVPISEKMTRGFLDLEEHIPIVGGVLSDLDSKVFGVSNQMSMAEKTAKSLHDRLVAYARGYEATVTIDASQAFRTLDQLREDLSFVNQEIGATGPGGGKGAARNQIEGEIAAQEAGPGSGAQLDQFALGLDRGPVRGPLGKPRVIVAHGGERVLTPDQFESLTSGRSGGSAGGIGLDAGTMQQLVALLQHLADHPIRAYTVASEMSHAQDRLAKRFR